MDNENEAWLDELCALLQETGVPPARRSSLSPTEERALKNQAISLTALGDFVILSERRGMQAAERLLQPIAKYFDIPIRCISSPPDEPGDDLDCQAGLTLPDAVGLLIIMERLGMWVDPRLLVTQLQPLLEGRNLLTDPEQDILAYEHLIGRGKITIRTQDPVPGSTPTTESFTNRAGNLVTITRSGGHAFALEVTGSRYKEMHRELVHCDYCSVDYVTNVPQEERRHDKEHERMRTLLDPSPCEHLAERCVKGLLGEMVDSDAPMWMQDAIYERARQFRREMGYDSIQWDGGQGHKVSSGWHGYLFAGDDVGTPVGACAFALDTDGVWVLSWIWVAPNFRRSGILAKRWQYFRERYGDFRIEPPHSEAMQAFVLRHGTDRQKSELQGSPYA